MTLTRRAIRWSAIGLNLAATCYYGVALTRFLFLERPFADLIGFIFSFHGLVFVAGFVAPALAVTALLSDRPH